MANILPPQIDPATLKSFGVVVGTEVAFTMKYPQEAENAIAALSSNPQIVEVPENLKSQVASGWTFDGENFIPPVE